MAALLLAINLYGVNSSFTSSGRIVVDKHYTYSLHGSLSDHGKTQATARQRFGQEDGKKQAGDKGNLTELQIVTSLRARLVDESSQTRNTGLSFGVTITHEPRYDLLGSFVSPSIYLHAVTQFYGWRLVILPFAGSLQEEILRNNFQLGDKIDKAWGTGFQDANRRKHYDPMKLNTDAHDFMNFLPIVSNASAHNYEWIKVHDIPLPQELPVICKNATRTGQCYLRLPDNPHFIQNYMHRVGGYDQFFSESFRDHLRTKFLSNKPSPRHFDQGTFNIAIHVRRGDILDPIRWIEQSVYVVVARRICQQHPEAAVHVFSSGPNRDGNWSSLETLSSDCKSVSFHIDEHEFDTWLHMVSAEAFVMSKSSFSIVPALLSRGDVYFPHGYGHVSLSHWRVFDVNTGELIK
jgi:hypothetical protein